MINDSTKNIGEILGVLEEMKQTGIIEKYAIGGAFAAILHYEPISTIDLDIFFKYYPPKGLSKIFTLDIKLVVCHQLCQLLIYILELIPVLVPVSY